MSQKIRPDLDIGGNLRKLRNANRLTQEQVAARLQVMGLDVSRSIYSRFESGVLNIKVSELIALKSIFKCNYEAFFEGLEN